MLIEQIALANIERQMARRAAERELRVVRAALAQPEPFKALQAAVQEHTVWTHRATGCRMSELEAYAVYRLQLTAWCGMQPDTEFLADAEETLLAVIRFSQRGNLSHGDAQHA